MKKKYIGGKKREQIKGITLAGTITVQDVQNAINSMSDNVNIYVNETLIIPSNFTISGLITSSYIDTFSWYTENLQDQKPNPKYIGGYKVKQ